jgi:drug/metabolite transporter (DMT)-like permease
MKGATIALISCALLALEPIFSKMLLQRMSPLAIVTVYSILGAVILVFILEIERKMREFGKMTGVEVTGLVALGLISGVSAQLLFVSGLKHTFATNAILLSRVNSLLIAFFGVLFLKEKITVNHVVGALLMITGVYYITTEGLSVSVNFSGGDIFILAAATCWATGNIVMKKYLCRIPPEIISTTRFSVAGIVLIFFTSSEIAAVEWSMEVIKPLLGIVFLVVIGGSILWYTAFEHTTATTIGCISLTMPLFGVIYAKLILHEFLYTFQIMGGTLILLGLAIIEIHLSTLVDWEHRLLSRHWFHH